jgi:hypothetical protein
MNASLALASPLNEGYWDMTDSGPPLVVVIFFIQNNKKGGVRKEEEI